MPENTNGRKPTTVREAGRRLRRLIVGISAEIQREQDEYIIEVSASEVARQVLPPDVQVNHLRKTENSLGNALRTGGFSTDEREIVRDLLPSTGPFVGCRRCIYPCRIRAFVQPLIGELTEVLSIFSGAPREEKIEALARSTSITAIFGYEDRDLEPVLDCAACILGSSSIKQATILAGWPKEQPAPSIAEAAAMKDWGTISDILASAFKRKIGPGLTKTSDEIGRLVRATEDNSQQASNLISRIEENNMPRRRSIFLAIALFLCGCALGSATMWFVFL